MSGGVRRIVLDESVLFGCEDPNGKDSLLPAAEYLLRKLRHSTIPTVILINSTLNPMWPNCPTMRGYQQDAYPISRMIGCTIKVHV